MALTDDDKRWMEQLEGVETQLLTAFHHALRQSIRVCAPIRPQSARLMSSKKR
jgi:hypothetical protein